MSDALTAAVEAAHALEADIDRLVAQMDHDELTLLTALAAVRPARQALGMVERVIEDAAARAMTGKRAEVAGEFYAERHRGKKRTTWAHDVLAHDVVTRAYLDTTTGEQHIPPPDAWRVRDALMAACNPTWRVTAIKAAGLDPDDYCASQPGRDTVQIIPAAEREDIAS